MTNSAKIVLTFALAIVALVKSSVSASVWGVADSPKNSVSFSSEKHPLEDSKSWDLHIERQSGVEEPSDLSGSWRRRLESAVLTATGTTTTSKANDDDDDGDGDGDGDDDDGDDDSWQLPFTVKHKKSKKHIPFAGGDTTHGIMIDAGSVSTRFRFVLHSWNTTSSSLSH